MTRPFGGGAFFVNDTFRYRLVISKVNNKTILKEFDKIMLQEIMFRGQKAIVCKGDVMPNGIEEGYLSYGIVGREDENSPMAIECNADKNLWGTIFTKSKITFDEYGTESSPIKRTTLFVDEAMTMMNYA
jgi:hypothetical protein